MKVVTFAIVCFLVLVQGVAMAADRIELTLLDGEFWWGGLSSLGHEMPYDATSTVSHDLWGDNKGNQAQPLLLSSKGRYIWSESPIKYDFDKGMLTVTVREGDILSGVAGKNLRDAYAYAVKTFFPPNGRIPGPEMFTHPQYNTWIELKYDQNEEDILTYARAIIDQGFPHGVIMIDDTWQENYGTWEFAPRRFQNPRKMMQELHDMGFKVMLWICPFVSADSEVFRELAAEGMLLLDPQLTQNILWANTKNKAAIIRWWNGASACLDLSNPKTQAWFKGRLDYLVNEYGVDGFKFDAGDARFYADGAISFKAGTPNDHTTYFAEVGLSYPLNEYRASWKMAGLPLAQRLRDKRHRWEDLKVLIPDLMSQSIMGYAYTCPDLIGGGEYRSLLNGAVVDEELVVRSAQVHALMPMMQFSVAPWRVLSKENAEICRQAALLHTRMGDTFLRLAREAAKTGEPIVKPMALAYPDDGYERIDDQFMLGEDILVAPAVEMGARSRTVIFPKGLWKGDDGSVVEGGKAIDIQVPLARLPYFKQVRK
jgi:alpha-glucosidase (family GH31 glycosyl hydrolase)